MDFESRQLRIGAFGDDLCVGLGWGGGECKSLTISIGYCGRREDRSGRNDFGRLGDGRIMDLCG